MRKATAAAIVTEPLSDERQYAEVLLSHLRLSPLNPRKHFDQVRLEELAASMANGVGVIEPLVVRPVEVGYEVVAGARRYKAAAIAGLVTVPVIIRTLTDAQVLELMVIENDQRADITPLEEAAGFKQLMVFGFDIDALAKRIGRSRKYIYDRVKLLDLVPDAQQLLEQGRITAGHAILLARLTPEQQAQVIDPENFYDDALFEEEAGLLTEAEEAANARQPYAGLKTRSVRELQGYIDQRFRFDAHAPVNLELYPDTAAAVQEADKVILITREFDVHREAKDGPRIVTARNWKRADGQERSKPCDRSVMALVALGPGRGEAFRVCVKKDCDVHWQEERQQREREAQSGTEGEAARKKRAADEERYRKQREKDESARQAWAKATPALREHALEKVKAAGIPVLVEFFLKNVYRQMAPALKALGKPKTGDDALRLLAFAVFHELAGSPYSGPRDMPAKLKPFGGDVAKVLKAAQTSAQPGSKKKAAKKR